MNKIEIKSLLRSALGACLLATVLLVTGCVKRDLELRPLPTETGKLELTLNWADGVSPIGARVYLYDDEGVFCQSVDCHSGGHVFDVPSGTYAMIVHNTDAQGVGYLGLESHATAVAYALNASGGAPMENELLSEPQNVYGIGQHDQGRTFTVEDNKITRITATAASLTKELALYIHITGLDIVTKVTGTMCGVSPSICFCTGKSGTLSCRQAFVAEPYLPQPLLAATKSLTTHQYASRMRLFDLLTRENSPAQTNTMDIAIEDGEGNVYSVSVDITQTLQQIISENEGILPINIALDVKLLVYPELAKISSTVEEWKNGAGSDTDVD